MVVWQDVKKLRAGQNWRDEFEAAIRGTAVVVAVSSPSYASSEWCGAERRLFAERVDLESSGRFFIALKTPSPDDAHTEFLPRIVSVSFARDDGSALVPGTREFAESLNHLASGVAETLQKMRREGSRVFVASPADDCFGLWKQLAGELKQKGYDVQPAGRRDSAFSDSLIVKEMSGAVLHLHLLGAAYDAFAARQIQLAVNRSRCRTGAR